MHGDHAPAGSHVNGNPTSGGLDLDLDAPTPTARECLVPWTQAAIEATPPKWVVDGLIAESAFLILAGRAKHARKTWLALQLAKCVGSGAPFGGRAVSRRQVIYLTLEDGINRIGYRGRLYGVDQPDGVEALSGPSGLPMVLLGSTIESYERLMTEMRQGQWRNTLVVVDTLSPLLAKKGIDENSSTAMTAFLEPHRQIAMVAASSILLLHHFGKHTNMMRGSSALEGACDGYLELHPYKKLPNVYELLSTLRDGPSGADYLRFVEDPSEHRVCFEAAERPEGASPSEERDAGRHGRGQSNGYRGGGDAHKEQKPNALEDDVLEWLAAHPNGGRVAQIARDTDHYRGAVSEALSRLCARRHALRVGFVYRLASQVEQPDADDDLDLLGL